MRQKQEEEHQACLNRIRQRLEHSGQSGEPIPLDEAFQEVAELIVMNPRNPEEIVAKKMKEIEAIDEALLMDSAGVMQAVDDLRKALNKVEECLDRRKFEEAANLGYSDVSSGFIFLQRTLGALQSSYYRKVSLVSDVAFDARMAYEEVAPFVDKKMDMAQPKTKK